MGAGAVDSLLFFSHSGPRALPSLDDELARRDLHMQDLLRLRLFTAGRPNADQMEHELESLLPRAQWPATSVVEIEHSGASGPLLDAIAAPEGRRKQSIGPTAARFGPWLFVGALRAQSDRRLPLSERIEQESRQVFANLERLLDSAGAGLRDVVKVGGWLRFPMSAYEPLARVRSELLARAGLFPASAAVQVRALAGPACDAEPLLAFEAVAFDRRSDAFAPRSGADAPHPGAFASGCERPPRTEDLAAARAVASPLASYYATARSAGGYVFTCGEIPRREGPVTEQVDDVYEQLRRHLEPHGASLEDVAQQTVFVRRDADVASVRRRIERLLGRVPPTTVLPAADLGFRRGVHVEIELVADVRS